ncbi:protein-disulfide reductase DsbD domain-containing protein [Methylovirgula sp. 4M-Z18]|uniref:protein-disulfide reductase DsbD domain-containing protein n=1 Tax=Methylovirgula sp. 4M-Z18 TaxID=2293567 RepID=UPI000E2F10AB|nr:protein-disulfide reductase DsbD domain-containing protein [Methylovirgula sp. 4M-Z18]RFB78852.1 hypothetical protein DYH55_13520 [Methylovirgula sp. 4M-Z18]
MKRLLIGLTALATFSSLVHGAELPSTPWIRTDKSAMRLQAQGMQNNSYIVGVEIQLTGNAITYWGDPGEAGVPPIFAFGGSDNVGKTEVLYPFPQRMDEGGALAFGYRDHVTFPVRVTPSDPAKPVQLKLQLDYAVCDQICMPAHGDGALTLSPQEKMGEWSAPADVPKLLPDGAASAYVVTPTHGSPKPVWTFTLKDKSWLADPHADLFVEAPDGWYFDTTKKPEGDGFTLTLAEKPKDAAWPTTITATFGTPQRSWEARLRLDEPAKAP